MRLFKGTPGGAVPAAGIAPNPRVSTSLLTNNGPHDPVNAAFIQRAGGSFPRAPLTTSRTADVKRKVRNNINHDFRNWAVVSHPDKRKRAARDPPRPIGPGRKQTLCKVRLYSRRGTMQSNERSNCEISFHNPPYAMTSGSPVKSISYSIHDNLPFQQSGRFFCFVVSKRKTAPRAPSRARGMIQAGPSWGRSGSGLGTVAADPRRCLSWIVARAEGTAAGGQLRAFLEINQGQGG